jgi:molecular chaperone DnaJ
MLKDH